MHRSLTDDLLRDVPILEARQPVREAVATILSADVPALPVVEAGGGFWGVFGEREMIAAAYPGYLGQLKYAGFVPHSLDVDIERRITSLDEPVGIHASRDRVAVGEGYSDAQLAETFLHHRVLIVPVVDGRGGVQGIITRNDFFKALVGQLDLT